MAGRFSVEAIFKAVDRFSAPISKMQSRVKRFTDAAERGIKDVDTASTKWLRGLSTASKTVAAATAVVAAGLITAAKPGMDFEQQMADLGATSLQTRDQIAELEKKALQLGAATQFSATEVGAAMENMAKAGFTNQQVLEGVEGMIYAAAAAGEDLAATTETVSSVMKGMGLEAREAARVADVLALASVRTNSSIGSLGESMSKVSSTARQLRVPLEDTVAMVALLQDVGLDASEAGSATATMLTMMAKPSDEVAAKMRAMGVSFQDAAGNMLAPAKVLAQLVKAGQKAGGNMKQVAFFADLVGMRGQKAAVNLKDLFAQGKVTELVEELERASGTAEKMAKLRMNTLGGDIDVLTEGVKGVAIELEAMASGSLRGAVQGMSKWVEENGKLITSGIGDFAKGIADNFGEIVKWGRRLGTIVAVITAAAVATKIWAGALAVISFFATANPVGLIAMAIVGAIALITAFWPEISKFFNDLWEGTKDLAGRIASGVGSAISAVWEPVKGFLFGLFKFWVGGMLLLTRPIYERMKPAIAFVAAAARFVVAAWQPIGEFFSGLWEGIKQDFVVVFDYFAEVAGRGVEFVKAVWAPIGEFFSGLWEGIKQDFVVVFDSILVRFEELWSGVKEIVGFVQDIGGEAIGALGGGGDRQVVSPQERTARTISETTNNEKAELTIRDETGKARMTKQPKGPGARIKLKPSGAF